MSEEPDFSVNPSPSLLLQHDKRSPMSSQSSQFQSFDIVDEKDVPRNEQLALEQLKAARVRLETLKQDRTQYIKSADVMLIYKHILKVLSELEKMRQENGSQIDSGGVVDKVLDDILQLISLFFLAVGRTKEVPAFYVQLVTIQRLLEYLNEGGYYAKNDLFSIENRLSEMRKTIDSVDVDENSCAYLRENVRYKLGQCDMSYEKANEKLATISQELAIVQQKLVSICRQLYALASRTTYDQKMLQNIISEMKEIKSKRNSDGYFMDDTGKVLEGNGQKICDELLHECEVFSNHLEKSTGLTAAIRDDPVLNEVYNKLFEIRRNLEHLSLTHRWTLREPDLYSYLKSLADIERKRVNGKFLNIKCEAPKEQIILQHMLRKSYALIYTLLTSSEPISEALMPINNQLKTIRRCLLLDRKSGRPVNVRDLYPYRMKLATIEAMRKDGKFLDEDGSIPEGQGAVNSLLAECFEIIADLQSDDDIAEELDDCTNDNNASRNISNMGFNKL